MSLRPSAIPALHFLREQLLLAGAAEQGGAGGVCRHRHCHDLLLERHRGDVGLPQRHLRRAGPRVQSLLLRRSPPGLGLPRLQGDFRGALVPPAHTVQHSWTAGVRQGVSFPYSALTVISNHSANVTIWECPFRPSFSQNCLSHCVLLQRHRQFLLPNMDLGRSVRCFQRGLPSEGPLLLRSADK